MTRALRSMPRRAWVAAFAAVVLAAAQTPTFAVDRWCWLMTIHAIREVVPSAAQLEAPEPRPDDPPSPLAILQAQAAIWAERTNGEIVGDVEPADAFAGKLVHWFSFVVPPLDDYRYRLFCVEHGLDPYPLRIARGRTPDTAFADVDDEEGLYTALQTLFGAPETLHVVRQLRTMIAEQRAAKGRGRAP